MRLCNFLCYLFIPIIAVIGFTIPKSPCELCLFSVKNIDKFITTNEAQTFFKTILIKSCKAFPETAMKIVGEENSCQGKIDCDILCQGMINENFDELLDILTKTKLSPDEICGNIDLCVKNHTQNIIIPNIYPTTRTSGTCTIHLPPLSMNFLSFAIISLEWFHANKIA